MTDKLINQLTHTALKDDSWVIEKTRGKSSDSYIISNKEEKLFVKFLNSNNSFNSINRLGELGITPQVIKSGKIENKHYIVQEYLSGTAPTLSWYLKSIPIVWQAINAYKLDKKLTRELHFFKTEYKQHVKSELESLELNFKKSPLANHSQVNAYLSQIQKASNHLKKSSLTPFHPDNNQANFMLSDGRFYIVDWEDISLSDELRDISYILFRFYPRKRWREVFKYLTYEYDEDKIYYWICHDLLRDSAWLASYGNDIDKQNYIDALAIAMERKENILREKI